jgi:hypothetical protein
MRRSQLTAYATEAGFAGVDVLPIEEFASFRFYRPAVETTDRSRSRES